MQRLLKYRWEILFTLFIIAALGFLYRPSSSIKAAGNNMVCKHAFHCPEVSLFSDKLLEKILTGW